jgi:NAD-dependent deacetylase
VELERLGRLETLVTQNVDGLHEAAGHSPDRIVELHGTNRRVACLDCRRDADSAAVFDSFRRTRRPPRCACGGLLKPATVMFGEQMPAEPFRRALAAAETADFVLSVGSTLEVEPAASVPLSAARRGVPYVLLNQGPTAHDRFATLRLEGDAALLLPAIVDRLKEHWANRSSAPPGVPTCGPAFSVGA